MLYLNEIFILSLSFVIYIGIFFMNNNNLNDNFQGNFGFGHSIGNGSNDNNDKKWLVVLLLSLGLVAVSAYSIYYERRPATPPVGLCGTTLQFFIEEYRIYADLFDRLVDPRIPLNDREIEANNFFRFLYRCSQLEGNERIFALNRLNELFGSNFTNFDDFYKSSKMFLDVGKRQSALR